MCACLNLCALYALWYHRIWKKTSDPWENRVTSGCEPPQVDTGSWTWGFSKSRKCSSALQHCTISPAPQTLFLICGILRSGPSRSTWPLGHQASEDWEEVGQGQKSFKRTKFKSYIVLMSVVNYSLLDNLKRLQAEVSTSESVDKLINLINHFTMCTYIKTFHCGL